MEDVVQWVGDELHDLLGLSDRYIAEYLVGLAKKASSSDGLIADLNDTGAITVNDNVISFAEKLWNKVPHKTVVEKPARAKEREARMQHQKNKSYQLLSDSDDETYVKMRKRSTESRAGMNMPRV